MDEPIYLDHSTLAQPSTHMINHLQPYLKRHWKNITAPYLTGKEPFAAVEGALRDIRSFLGLRAADQFVFTSSGAEATAQVYQSVYIEHLVESGKNHILTTHVEEAPILLSGKRYDKLGCVQKMIPLNANGQVTREHLEHMLSPRTGLVSLSWANGFTGVMHPIWELAELCREKGVLFHVDGSHVLGKLYFKFQDLPVDYLTFDGSVIHGPKGSGGLVTTEDTHFVSMIPEGMPGCHLNEAALVGLGIAFDEMAHAFDHLCMETARLRDTLESEIQHAIPEVKVLFQDVERLPNVTTLVFPGVRSELLSFHLREKGVFASFGGGRMQKLENLLMACGIENVDARCALSFSLSRTTTEEEIRRAIGLIVDAAQRCRHYAPKELV